MHVSSVVLKDAVMHSAVILTQDQLLSVCLAVLVLKGKFTQIVPKMYEVLSAVEQIRRYF